MSNYWDKHYGEGSTELDPTGLIPNNDPGPGPLTLETLTAGPTADGLPASTEEKRFYDQAQAVLAAEEALPDGPSPTEIALRRKAAINALLTGAWLSMNYASNALNALRPDDISDEALSRLTHMAWSGEDLMKRARELREQCERAANSAQLRQNLKASVEQARAEQGDA